MTDLSRLAAAALMAMTFIGASGLAAHAQQQGGIAVSQAWTRATPPGAKVAGGFLVIENRGSAPDRLTGGSFAGAGRLEVHEMAMNNGVMQMRELAQGIIIPPGGKVELKPGGLHVMFMDLKQPLAQGSPVKGILLFEKAGAVPVEYQIAPVGARSPGHLHH